MIYISCYHPLKAFILSDSNGKKNVKICSLNVNHLEKSLYSNNYLLCYNNEKQFPDSIRFDDYVEVPCGKCIGCRLDYSRMWSCRLLCELETQPQGSKSYFVTLTYSDETVPTVDSNDFDAPLLSLRKRDLQLFLKSLRKAFPEFRIRFFACGEYGSNTFRPHYHMILFNCPVDDLRLLRVVDGKCFYSSDLLSSIWKRGFVTLSDVTAESCAYVAQYCTKKAFGNLRDDFAELGIEPEFLSMSRKPGIGFDWLQKHQNLLESPVINVSTPNGGRQFVIPRYFLNKLQENPQNRDFVELVKEAKHGYWLSKLDSERFVSSKSRSERLLDAERVKSKSVRKDRSLDSDSVFDFKERIDFRERSKES